MAQQRIDYLDGMRGLAILTVIAYHYLAQIDGVALSDYYEAHTILHYAYLSVPLFFTISGYVIFLTLDKTATLGGFLVRRWIRLFPAMLIASIAIPLIAYFFPYRHGGMPQLIDVVPGLTFLGANVVSALTRIQTEGLEGGFWTVYVEVRFYVMFGICYYVLGKRNAFYFLAAMCLAISLLLNLAPFVLDATNVRRAESLFGKMLIGYHLPWFVLGMYAYLFDFKKHTWLLLLILCSALSYNRVGIGSLAATTTLILLIVGAFTTPLVQAAFRTRLLLFFGFVSYPLYLFNDSIGRGIVRGLYDYFGERVPFELLSLAALAVILPPVWCIANYAEPAMQRWLKQRLISRRPPGAVIAPPLSQG